MVQRRQHARLALEPRQPIGVVANRSRQDLQGHLPAQLRIAGPETYPSRRRQSAQRSRTERRRTPEDNLTSALVYFFLSSSNQLITTFSSALA